MSITNMHNTIMLFKRGEEDKELSKSFCQKREHLAQKVFLLDPSFVRIHRTHKRALQLGVIDFAAVFLQQR